MSQKLLIVFKEKFLKKLTLISIKILKLNSASSINLFLLNKSLFGNL